MTVWRLLSSERSHTAGSLKSCFPWEAPISHRFSRFMPDPGRNGRQSNKAERQQKTLLLKGLGFFGFVLLCFHQILPFLPSS